MIVYEHVSMQLRLFGGGGQHALNAEKYDPYQFQTKKKYEHVKSYGKMHNYFDRAVLSHDFRVNTSRKLIIQFESNR